MGKDITGMLRVTRAPTLVPNTAFSKTPSCHLEIWTKQILFSFIPSSRPKEQWAHTFKQLLPSLAFLLVISMSNTCSEWSWKFFKQLCMCVFAFKSKKLNGPEFASSGHNGNLSVTFSLIFLESLPLTKCQCVCLGLFTPIQESFLTHPLKGQQATQTDLALDQQILPLHFTHLCSTKHMVNSWEPAGFHDQDKAKIQMDTHTQEYRN